VFLHDVGEHEPAVTVVEEALELHRAVDLGDPLGRGRAELVLGGCLLRLGRREAAREHLQDAGHWFDLNPAATADERARVERLLEEVTRRAGG